VRPELLNIPERRSTNVPELLAFFREIDDGRATDLTLRFIRSFAGTAFTMPGVEFLHGLQRDEQIFKSLQTDVSAENRVALLREHRIDYATMENIYRVCSEKNLEPPLCAGGRAQAVEEAAQWISKYKSLASDVVAMYALTAPERTRAMGIACVTAKEIQMAVDTKKPTLTLAQKALLKALKDAGGTSTPRELGRNMRTIVPTKTIRALMALKLVTHPSKPDADINVNAKVKLTKKGAALA
jgi:hypothetical protein